MAKAGNINREPGGFADASAAFVPASPGVSAGPASLWGALRGSVSVTPGCDLTAPTGETWSADT